MIVSSHADINGSDVPFLRSLLVVEERMKFSEYFQHCLAAGKTSPQKLYTNYHSWKCTLLLLLLLNTFKTCLKSARRRIAGAVRPRNEL